MAMRKISNMKTIRKCSYCEIQVMTWDRHKNVTGLNLLIGSKLSPIDNWRSNGNTYINKL
jgi:hypothetical protein